MKKEMKKFRSFVVITNLEHPNDISMVSVGVRAETSEQAKELSIIEAEAVLARLLATKAENVGINRTIRTGLERNRK